LKRRNVVPLSRFALAAARGDTAGVERAIDAARRAGWPRAAIEETALMLTLYAGYPAAIESLRTLAERWPAATVPRAGEVPEDERGKRGLAALARVYGDSRPPLLRGLARLHPALANWVVEHGYGRVLARGRLDLRARELITVTLLAAGGWERQLASHVLGAARAGATRAEITSQLRLGRGVSGSPAPPRAEPVLRLARTRVSRTRR